MPRLKTIHPPQPAPLRDPALTRKAVNVAEASLIMGVGQTNLRQLIAAGKLGVIRVGLKGRGIVIPLAAIDLYIVEATEKVKQ